MPIYILDYADRLNEWEKVSENNSRLLVNCLESIDGALWLIAGSRIPQALVLLHSSVEAALKAELERVHPALIANQKLDYPTLKSLLKDSFRAHPRGHQVKIPDFDIEHTIKFEVAINRVAELYPSIDNWKDQLKHVNSLRNDVVHYGSGYKKKGEYIASIATTLFPFLEQFLEETSGIALKNIVTQPIYQELKVSKGVCERLLSEGKPPNAYVFKTVARKVFHTYVDWPTLPDITGEDDGEAEFQMIEAMKSKLEREWEDNYIETSCRICSSSSLFVKVEFTSTPKRSIIITAAKCPICGLDIDEKERFLAEYHVGALGREEIDNFMRDVGEVD